MCVTWRLDPDHVPNRRLEHGATRTEHEHDIEIQQNAASISHRNQSTAADRDEALAHLAPRIVINEIISLVRFRWARGSATSVVCLVISITDLKAAAGLR